MESVSENIRYMFHVTTADSTSHFFLSTRKAKPSDMAQSPSAEEFPNNLPGCHSQIHLKLEAGKSKQFLHDISRVNSLHWKIIQDLVGYISKGEVVNTRKGDTACCIITGTWPNHVGHAADSRKRSQEGYPYICLFRISGGLSEHTKPVLASTWASSLQSTDGTPCRHSADLEGCLLPSG